MGGGKTQHNKKEEKANKTEQKNLFWTTTLATVTNNDYTGSCIQPTNQSRCLKKRKKRKSFPRQVRLQRQWLRPGIQTAIYSNQPVRFVTGKVPSSLSTGRQSQKRVGSSMEESEVTPSGFGSLSFPHTFIAVVPRNQFTGVSFIQKQTEVAASLLPTSYSRFAK